MFFRQRPVRGAKGWPWPSVDADDRSGRAGFGGRVRHEVVGHVEQLGGVDRAVLDLDDLLDVVLVMSFIMNLMMSLMTF